jgi:sortase (surface protein transpeptidase)
LPSRIYVPSLGIDSAYVPERIVSASLTIPSDVHTVGFYDAGGQIGGTTGTVLLASHVNYVGQGRGTFYKLALIRPLADIWVTDSESLPTHWRVTGLADPVKADLDQSIFNSSGQRRLVLVTCGGALHAGSYDRNVVVYASPVFGPLER